MSNDRQDQGGSPGAGWYQDPWDNHRRRYWDGQQWTGDVSFEPPRNWGGEPEATAQQAGYGQVPQPDPAPQQADPGPQPGYGYPQGGGYQPSSQPTQPSSQPTQQQPPALQEPVASPPPGWGGYPGQQGAPQWPAATQEYPTQVGWGGGGWGQPPQVPAGPYAGGLPAWQQHPPADQRGNRVHVAIVAMIAAIAVLAGIGIGSQLNSSSSSSNTAAPGTGLPSGGTGGTGGGGGTFVNPFGGGNGTGSTSGGSGGTSLSAAQKAIVNKVDKSVVDVNTDLGYQNGAAAGTGMVLTSNGTVLTNNHVIDQATSISVTLVSTGRTYKATVVGTDVTQDVAVLQMQGASGLTPINIGNSSSVSRGDSVVAIGNAGGAGGTPSAVTGTVTGLNQTITASDSDGSNSEVLDGLIQTDAPIQAGDSGGPLVNSKGQVVGMDTAASSANAVSGSNSVGFSIPISSATTIATKIQHGQASAKIHIGPTGFLGVSVQNSAAPGSLGSQFGGDGTTVQGAMVAKVVPGSPAAKAGIVEGDTITGVDGTSVATATGLTAQLRSHHPGDQVSVTWVDASGASHTATVTLTEGPAA